MRGAKAVTLVDGCCVAICYDAEVVCVCRNNISGSGASSWGMLIVLADVCWCQDKSVQQLLLALMC